MSNQGGAVLKMRSRCQRPQFKSRLLHFQPSFPLVRLGKQKVAPMLGPCTHLGDLDGGQCRLLALAWSSSGGPPSTLGPLSLDRHKNHHM